VTRAPSDMSAREFAQHIARGVSDVPGRFAVLIIVADADAAELGMVDHPYGAARFILPLAADAAARGPVAVFDPGDEP